MATRYCPNCGGEGFGRGFDGDCPACKGTGKVPVEQSRKAHTAIFGDPRTLEEVKRDADRSINMGDAIMLAEDTLGPTWASQDDLGDVLDMAEVERSLGAGIKAAMQEDDKSTLDEVKASSLRFGPLQGKLGPQVRALIQASLEDDNPGIVKSVTTGDDGFTIFFNNGYAFYFELATTGIGFDPRKDLK